MGTIERDVTWGDCDPAGIIYYPTYFRWIDAGRIGKSIRPWRHGTT